MPKLASLARDTAEVSIPLEGDDPLALVFRKGFMSPELAERFDAVDGMTPSEQLGVLAHLVHAAVVRWNLTDDAGEPIPLAIEAIRGVNAEALQIIVVAIQDALRPDPQNGPASSASSPAAEGSEAVPIGTPS